MYEKVNGNGAKHGKKYIFSIVICCGVYTRTFFTDFVSKLEFDMGFLIEHDKRNEISMLHSKFFENIFLPFLNLILPRKEQG